MAQHSPTDPKNLGPSGAAALDKLLQDSVSGRNVPATYFGVTTADGPLYFNCAGEKVFGEPDKGEIQEDTMLQLFSATKLVTTVAVLQLLDRGIISSLDDPSLIEKHLPDLGQMQILTGFDEDSGKPLLVERKKPLTLKRLLSHSSGLKYSFNAPLLARWERDTGHPSMFESGVEYFTEPLLAEPGTKWAYSTGIDWGGILVERLTGQTLEAYFQANIFKPFGLTSMTFYPTEANRPHFQKICGRDKPNIGKLVDGISPRDINKPVKHCMAGGGLLGTARDYLKFLQAILASRNKHDGALISPSSFEILFTNALPPRGRHNTCYEDLAAFALEQTYHDPAHVAARSLEHSVGLCLNPHDSIHGRHGGSGCWDGAAKTQYWLDPAAGIAGICFTQLLSPNPDPFMVLYNKFERTVYDHLG